MRRHNGWELPKGNQHQRDQAGCENPEQDSVRAAACGSWVVRLTIFASAAWVGRRPFPCQRRGYSLQYLDTTESSRKRDLVCSADGAAVAMPELVEELALRHHGLSQAGCPVCAG